MAARLQEVKTEASPDPREVAHVDQADRKTISRGIGVGALCHAAVFVVAFAASRAS
jgi:hypothetical protein